MSDSKKDLDWLYRREDEEFEHTRVMPPVVDPPTRPQAAAPGPRPQATPTAPAAWPTPQQAAHTQAAGPAPSAPRTQAAPPGRPPAPPTSTAPPSPRKKRRRPVLTTILALVIAWLVFLVGTPVYALGRSDTVEAFPSERLPGQPGTTYLLVGSDAREDLTKEEQKRLGTGSTEGRRTDTMMLLHLPRSGDPVLLSLPRDSLVSIPGRKKNKLNAAYAFGGAPLLVETVEANTGIRVDGYLEIGFLGIVDMVDAVGGIEVCPAFDIDDRDSHLKLDEGCQDVDGVTALGYVRMRKQDPRGDLGRMERQREVIAAIMKGVVSPATVLNPIRYWNVNQAAASSLARGEGTGMIDLGRIGLGFLSVTTGKGISMTVPIADANRMTDVGSTVIWDEKAADGVFAALADGDTTPLEKYRA
jgi:LCP family protein required for cell wall assembly